MWIPYLAVASEDDIISQAPWFIQCMEWIRQLRNDCYTYFLNKMQESNPNQETSIHGLILMLTIIEEQIPLSHIVSWWKPNNPSVVISSFSNIKEWMFGDFVVHRNCDKPKNWWMDKRLFWHCLPHMKQLHNLLHNSDEIHDKLQPTLPSTIRKGTGRKIQPFLAVGAPIRMYIFL